MASFSKKKFLNTVKALRKKGTTYETMTALLSRDLAYADSRKELKIKIMRLEQENEKLKQNQGDPNMVNGWRIFQSNGYWYAYKKGQTVYIGKKLSKALFKKKLPIDSFGL